jgi:hypothetical protein
VGTPRCVPHRFVASKGRISVSIPRVGVSFPHSGPRTRPLVLTGPEKQGPALL